jgi:hypothetical protein
MHTQPALLKQCVCPTEEEKTKLSYDGYWFPSFQLTSEDGTNGSASHKEAWVADRTGHRSSQMINRYRRPARQASELQLGELTPLDEALQVNQQLNHEKEAVVISPTILSGSTGTRTRDLRIKSPQLYRLSYRPDGPDPSRTLASTQPEPKPASVLRKPARSAGARDARSASRPPEKPSAPSRALST